MRHVQHMLNYGMTVRIRHIVYRVQNLQRVSWSGSILVCYYKRYYVVSHYKPTF